MNAAEVIEAQADLHWRLVEHRTPATREGDAAPLMQYLFHLAQRGTGDAELAEFLTVRAVKGVGRARAYRVQENMTEAIERRAREFDPDMKVSRDDMPPRPDGIVRLEEPLRFVNHGGLDQAAHWITWSGFEEADTALRGAVITLWNDVLTEPDQQIRATWAETQVASPLDIRGGEGHRTLFGRWAPVTIGYIVEGATIEAPHYATRLLLALWALLGETVPASGGDRVEATEDHLSRTVRRRAARDGIEAPAVTTVVLRRESRPTINPGTGTPWDSRVWIEGYEAWRWVGPRHDRRRVRRWIPGHWSVNNEELPVRQRKIVSELRR